MELQYVTKGNSTPKGKEKVYFACHGDDFGLYFNEITKDIFKSQNCVVYYNENESEKWSEEELRLDFSQMQLVVIPITSNFLFKDCRARNVEFKYAIEHHIPVLPLMQESGLEKYFNEICGDLQFLDKKHTDATALPYEEKLEKFLKSVLIGDELAARIRAAFDAYIFLSYRKKDRKYAQELMRLIHRNDFARDIAIWYDEYLTPGEDFNEAIAEAMTKSELFAMVVTPNLVDEENYVKNVEYPEAVKAGKEILPAEMVGTDRGKLKCSFESIPEVIDGHSEAELSEALKKRLKNIAVSENDSDMQHVFFIGLAYLGGIDVEVDYEKAAELITRAAEAGFAEAVEKLVFMYQNGEGVRRDYYRAIEWQEKLCEIYRERYENAPNGDNAVDYFNRLLRLGDYCYEVRDVEKAKAAYEKMRELAMEVKETFDFRRALSVSYDKLGDIEKATGDLKAAKEYYEKSLEISEMLAAETGTIEARRDLSISCERLGDIANVTRNLKSAKEYYDKSMAIREGLADDTGTVEARRDLSASYERLGNIAEAMGDLRTAKGYYEKIMEIFENITEETGTVEARRDLSVSYNRLGDIAKATGDLRTAKDYYEKSMAIREGLAEETGMIDARRDLSVSYDRLGDIAKATGDLRTAKDCYKKSVAIREGLAEETGTVEARRDLSVSYNRLGDTVNAMGDLKAAKCYYEKDLSISEVLSEEMGTIESRRDLSISYERLGDIAKATGDLRTAKDYYKKSMEIRERLAEETGTVESYDDLAIAYFKAADINDNELQLLKKAYNIYEKLVEVCPEVKRFKENLKIIGDIIDKEEKKTVKRSVWKKLFGSKKGRN